MTWLHLKQSVFLKGQIMNARNILNSKGRAKATNEEASATEKQKWDTEVLKEWKQGEKAIWRAQKVVPPGGAPMVGIRKFILKRDGTETMTGQGILVPFDKEVNEVLTALVDLLTICKAGHRKLKEPEKDTTYYVLMHKSGIGFGGVDAKGQRLRGLPKQFGTSAQAKAFREKEIPSKYVPDFKVKKVIQ
jgi:hypothetical protein